MTWVEWCYYSNGLNKAKLREWEHTRQISWMIYKANSDPKTSSKNMNTWWPLPTDRKREEPKKIGRKLTKKQIVEFFNLMR